MNETETAKNILCDSNISLYEPTFSSPPLSDCLLGISNLRT